MAAGRTALVVAAEPIGIMTYNADGNHRCRCCPCGEATADVMMTMADKKGGEAMARRRRGDGEATTRQQRGNKYVKATSYHAAGGRGKEAINKRITNTI
jgi:hypothetical protein